MAAETNSTVTTSGAILDGEAQPVPFFSANDLRIDPSDPVLRTLPPVGGLPYPRPHPPPMTRSTEPSVLSARKASPSHKGGSFPVSIEPTGDDYSDNSLLYSFSIPSTKPHPSKPPSVTESFGVLSTQVSRSGTASPHYHQSNTPSIVSDSEHSEYRDVSIDTPNTSDIETETKQSRDSDTITHTTAPPTDIRLGETTGTPVITSASRDVTPTPEYGPPSQTVASPVYHESCQEPNLHTTQTTPIEQSSSCDTQEQTHLDSTLNSHPDESPPPSSPQRFRDLDLPPHRPSRLDSDIETSSVVSVQHLTEAYLNDPFDPAEEMLTVGTNSTIVPVVLPVKVSDNRKSRTPTPSEGKSLLPTKTLPEGFPRGQGDLSHNPEPTSSSRLPAHIQPSPKVQVKRWPRGSSSNEKISPTSSSTSYSSVLPTVPKRSVSGSQSDGDRIPSNKTPEPQVKELEDKLTKALQAKVNLEGQLESVVSECKNTLKDRASLQSKLGKAEAQLAELSKALERERQRKSVPESSKTLQSPSDVLGEEVEQLKETLEETRNALENEKKESSLLKNDLAKLKHDNQDLENELTDTQNVLNDREEALTALQEKTKTLQNELDQKKNEMGEEQCKSSSLEASYAALEETKGWLHQQLQDSLEAKMKLQEELREAKANGIAQCIKAEQLMKENAAFQDQISGLQRGVLQDKARLVSELEAIEADVLSREDSYGHILAEKGQLEDLVKMRNDAMETLSSELAKARVRKDELEEKAEDLEMRNDVLTHQIKDLDRNRKSLEDKLNTTEQDLKAKEAGLIEMEKLKASLQERVRENAAALIGKDGTMQGLNDAKEIMRQELEMVKDARENAEKELDEAKIEVARLEDDLKSALDKNREKDSILKAATQNQHAIAAEREGLSAQLNKKDKQLEEKVEELQALESQSGELLDHFKNLQDQFQTIASRSGDVQDSVAEKDRVISHLASEKDNMEDELSSLREEKENLENKLVHLQQEKAHLEGMMETSPSKTLEEFQKQIQDKSELQTELNALKMNNQRDLIKAQAKANHLEADLRAAKRDSTKTQKELEDIVKNHEEEVSKLEDENARLQSDLRNAAHKLEDSVKSDSSPQLHSSLRQSEGDRERLRAKLDQLTKENRDLGEQLEHEVAQKAEIERAGSVVARNLKQNAKESERKLQDQIQDLALQVEKLRGQLAGMEITQSAMREHAEGLEMALAKREAVLVRLSAQAQKVLEEKELEDKHLTNKIESLEKQLEDSKNHHRHSKEKASEERKKMVKLTRELSNKDKELSDLKQALQQTSKSAQDSSSLQDRLTELTAEKDKLQTDLAKTSTQLAMAKTTADSMSRELTDKEAQVDILKQELDIAKSRDNQIEQELGQVRSQLKGARERHSIEIEDLKRALGEAERRESSAVEGVSGGRGLFDASLSTIGVDETDKPGEPSSAEETLSTDVDKVEKLNDSLRESSQKTVSELLGYNSLYRAQLAEMGSRLEHARKQGQKVAEIKKSGEISALQEQLGSKSKTIHGLQSCLLSLKGDMGKLQSQMDQHTAVMQASHASTRQIESQIENLKKSSALPSPLFLSSSTPTNQSE